MIDRISHEPDISHIPRYTRFTEHSLTQVVARVTSGSGLVIAVRRDGDHLSNVCELWANSEEERDGWIRSIDEAAAEWIRTEETRQAIA